MSTLELFVARRRMEAQDIASFELRRPDGGPLPPFSAGAHIDLTAPNGMLRQYSLCNAPSERHRYVIAVLRDPASRGGSQSLVDDLHKGHRVQVGMPRNHFVLAAAPRTLLLGGGIGITPLLAMAEHLHAGGSWFALHYCARSPERAAFIDRIAAAPYAAWASVHFDDGAPAQRLDLDALLRQADSDTEPDALMYVCGPAGFIAAVRAAAARHGWPAGRVHVEHFGAALPRPGLASGFQVRIASTGQLVQVAPQCSVADALRDAGIALPLSCGEGVCGSCLTRVLDGVPDHQDEFLSDEEKARNDRFLPCCSRAISALLVLDL